MSAPHEPAFPVADDVTESGNGISSIVGASKGLTKREMIAAMAMQGLASAWNNTGETWTAQKQAALAMEMADALLAELAKEKP